MAINTKETNTAQTSTMQSAFNAAGVDQQAKSSVDIFSNTLFAAPMAANQSGEYLSKLTKLIVAKYDESSRKENFKVIPLEMVEFGLAASVIVVAYSDAARKTVVFHPLLLEATCDSLTPVVSNVRNIKVETILTVEDGYDQQLADICYTVLRKHYQNYNIYETDGEVVSRLFDMENRDQLHRLAMNAGLACATKLDSHASTFSDVSVVEIVAANRQLKAEITYNNKGKTAANGQPIRNDLTVEFSSRQITEREVSQSIHNQANREVKISTVSGYVDLLWAPVENTDAYNPYAQQVQTQTQKYGANIVITDIESQAAYTTGSILLALVTAFSVREPTNWIQYFRPGASTTPINLRDVGILNLEANLLREAVPTKINTLAADFTVKDLGGLVAAMIRPNPVMSLDVSPANSSSWYMSVFAEAAKGVPGAISEIVNAANQLTGNTFTNYFQPGMAMFANTELVHLGYYTDVNGEKKDLREIDYLAVANFMAEKDIEFLRDYSETWTNAALSPEVRLSMRNKIIRSLAGDTAVITSTAFRVTFSNEFLNALATAVKNCGLTLSVKTPLNASDFSTTRNSASFIGNGTFAPAFNVVSGYDNGAAGYNYGARHSIWR